MSDLVFYTSPMSRGRIVRWMLEELGQPYETRLLDFGTTMKAPEYLAVNPMGKVPAITHNGTAVTESAAICAYLADAFPAAGLKPPPGSTGSGAYYRWLFFAAGPYEEAALRKACGFVLPPGKAVMAGAGGNFSAIEDGLEQAVSQGPYIAGDAFSAADVYVGGQIGFGLMFESLERRPAFLTYLERVNARPAYRRAVAIDDALLARPTA